MSVDAATSFTKHGFIVRDALLGDADLLGVESALAAWTSRQIDEWSGPARRDAAAFKEDFYAAWLAAGRPAFRRSPQRNLAHPGFYAFLRSPALLDAVGEILGTDEISVHGIFNARPMMPDAAVTPWHMDAQYLRSHGEPSPEAAQSRTVITVWTPLQDLDSQLGGLEVAPLDQTLRRVYDDDYVDAATGYIAVPPASAAEWHGEAPMLKRGGCIFFSQLAAHRGTPNRSQRIRWSVDVRYEATENAIVSGRRFGFVARSRSGRYAEETFEDWQARCAASLARGAQ